MAIRAVPRRTDFYTKLAQGGSIEKLDTELAKWLAGLEIIVERVGTFLKDGNYVKV